MATFDFQAHRGSIERQAAQAQKTLAGLHTFEGKPVYPPEIQSQQVERALAPLRTSVQEAQTLAESAQEEARRLTSLGDFDPLTVLSNDELVRLNASRDLARDEIGSLSPAQLSSRLVAVQASGDKVSMLLHLLYAQQKVTESGDPRLHAQLADIDEAVYGKQREKAAKALEQAQTLREQAAELSFFAGHTLAEIDGSNAQAMAQRRLDYGGVF